ncbi:uracil phosphoribosyltransferase [uncultured Dokdonia sp.]|uniref:uracil phosphoribosyltransferase n=1 Tax=uncultured Dokdonia sp. TaxID=575653 RepID=UPI002634B80E|nr:uracil phosphoribosyltransferase [uncultured Dokdonia sp.]
MKVHDFTSKKTVLQRFIAQLRDQEIQKDSLRFRINIERIGHILAYEMSQQLSYITHTVKTPLGIKEMFLPKENIVIAAILRAGLPLQQGVVSCFDNAEQAFISAYRNHPDADTLEIVVKYLAAPSLEGKTLILCDPMLATGHTLENVYLALKDHGTPESIHIISVIGSHEGVKYIQDIFPEKTHLWIAAIDEDLNDEKYILPGLGDAGDLSYGMKL